MRVDSGLVALAGDNTFHAVPNVAADFQMVGFLLTNTTAAAIDVAMSDGNDVVIRPLQPVGAGGPYITSTFLLPVAAGVKWKAAAVGVNGQVWGYK
jgi:hypothetical protein